MVEDVNRGASRAKPEDGKNVGREEIAQRREGREGFFGKVWGDIVGEFRGLLMGSGFHFSETKAVSPARESVDRVPRMTEKAPPPLRAPAARSNVLAAVAFGFAVASACLACGAIYILADYARYVSGVPGYMISGGIGFSLSFIPWAFLLGAICLGVIGALLVFSSLWDSRVSKQPLWTIFHVGGLVALTPVLYLFFRFLIRIIF